MRVEPEAIKMSTHQASIFLAVDRADLEYNSYLVLPSHTVLPATISKKIKAKRFKKICQNMCVFTSYDSTTFKNFSSKFDNNIGKQKRQI